MSPRTARKRQDRRLRKEKAADGEDVDAEHGPSDDEAVHDVVDEADTLRSVKVLRKVAAAEGDWMVIGGATSMPSRKSAKTRGSMQRQRVTVRRRKANIVRKRSR